VYAVAKKPKGICQVTVECLNDHKCKIETGHN
jgi:hypothetical protein